MTTPHPERLAADMIRELTHHHTTTEHRPRRVPLPTTTKGSLHEHGWTSLPDITELHVVTHEPLLRQLANATPGSTHLSDEAAATRATSNPAAHLEALDLLARIDHQSAALAAEHGIDEPDLTRRLVRLSGFIGHHPHRQVKAWWAAARVVAQYDSPAYRPHNAPCPHCWEVGTLRIRVDDELAHCTSCAETWDTTGTPDSRPLSLLAQHVRWCTDHDVTKPRHWKIDEVGYPVECVECLDFRQAWGAWRTEHAADVARGA